MIQIKNVNLFGGGYWGSKINTTLIDMGIKVNVIDPQLGTTVDNANPQHPAIIATPTPTHYGLALALIQRGFDILIEKPVATSFYQIMGLHQAVRPNQIVMPGHLYMFNPMLDSFKESIMECGNPKFIQFVRTNFGRYQTNTDVLHNIAFHDFSILHHLYDNIEITHSQGFDLSNNKVPDKAIVIGKADGIPFQIEASWLDAQRQRSVSFHGDSGQVVWDSDSNYIEVSNFTVNPLTRTSKILYQTTRETPLQNELIHFLQCVEDRVQPVTTLADALKIEQSINNAITSRS